jgi:hypothetical protein
MLLFALFIQSILCLPETIDIDGEKKASFAVTVEDLMNDAYPGFAWTQPDSVEEQWEMTVEFTPDFEEFADLGVEIRMLRYDLQGEKCGSTVGSRASFASRAFDRFGDACFVAGSTDPLLTQNDTSCIYLLDPCSAAPGTRLIVAGQMTTVTLANATTGQIITPSSLSLTLPEDGAWRSIVVGTLSAQVDASPSDTTTMGVDQEKAGAPISFTKSDVTIARGKTHQWGPIEFPDGDDSGILSVQVVPKGANGQSEDHVAQLRGFPCVTLANCRLNSDSCVMSVSTPEAVCGLGVSRSPFYVIVRSNQDAEADSFDYDVVIHLVPNPKAPKVIKKDEEATGVAVPKEGPQFYKLAGDWGKGDDVEVSLTSSATALGVESVRVDLTTAELADIAGQRCPQSFTCTADGPGATCTITLNGCGLADQQRDKVLLTVRSTTGGPSTDVSQDIGYTLSYKVTAREGAEVTLPLDDPLEGELLGDADGSQSYKVALPSSIDNEAGWVEVRLRDIEFPDNNNMRVSGARGFVPFGNCRDGAETACTNNPTCPPIAREANSRNGNFYDFGTMSNKEGDFYFVVARQGGSSFTYTVEATLGEVSSVSLPSSGVANEDFALTASQRRRYVLTGITSGSGATVEITADNSTDGGILDARLYEHFDGAMRQIDICANVQPDESCVLDLACRQGKIILELDNRGADEMAGSFAFASQASSIVAVKPDGPAVKTDGALKPGESNTFAFTLDKDRAVRVQGRVVSDEPGIITISVSQACLRVGSRVCDESGGLIQRTCTVDITSPQLAVKGDWIITVTAAGTNRQPVKAELEVTTGSSATCTPGGDLVAALDVASSLVGLSSVCLDLIDGDELYATPTGNLMNNDRTAETEAIRLASNMRSKACESSGLGLACRESFPLCEAKTGYTRPACREECERISVGCGGSVDCTNTVCGNLDVCDVANCVVGSNAPSCAATLVGNADGSLNDLSGDDGLGGGAIAGIVIAVLCLLCCCGAAAFFVVRGGSMPSLPSRGGSAAASSVHRPAGGGGAAAAPAPTARQAAPTANYENASDLISNENGPPMRQSSYMSIDTSNQGSAMELPEYGRSETPSHLLTELEQQRSSGVITDVEYQEARREIEMHAS